MGSFSIWHWIIVLIVVVLVFGTAKLKNIGKDLGGAIKDFKKGLNDDEGKDAIEGTAKEVRKETVEEQTKV